MLGIEAAMRDKASVRSIAELDWTVGGALVVIASEAPAGGDAEPANRGDGTTGCSGG